MSDTKDTKSMHDIKEELIQDGDRVTRKKSQVIPQSFIQDLRNQRFASSHTREGENQRLASIPVAVHEKWLREGFDLFQHSHKDVLKRLRAENLDAFITTNKQV